MKIAFLIPNLAHGGAEKVLVNLVNHMNREKFDVTVITLFDEGVNRQFLEKHVHYKYCFRRAVRGNSHIMKLFSPKMLFRRAVKEKYDVIVSYLEGPTARVVSGCPEDGTKLVCWIHTSQQSKANGAKSFRSYREALHSYERFDKIICVSQSVKEDFQNLFPVSAPVEVLYNTIEDEKIRRLAAEPIANSPFREGEIKLCGVGKLTKTKGFDRLARIHKRLIEEGFPVHTYLLGIGPEQEALERFVRENHLEDSFTLLGYQINPYQYVAGCDLFVCSSWAEGYSTAVTEALIVGTPVVTTRVSGMEELLGEHDEYGVITENEEEALYQGIRQLVSDDKKRQYYAQKALQRSEMFHTENTVAAVEKMFEELV